MIWSWMEEHLGREWCKSAKIETILLSLSHSAVVCLARKNNSNCKLQNQVHDQLAKGWDRVKEKRNDSIDLNLLNGLVTKYLVIC